MLDEPVVEIHGRRADDEGAQALARGEVAGSTRKMFRQKGTGNARTGGIRNPIKVGGGHAKNKQPKDWRLGMPKKARRAARNSALLAKIQANEVLRMRTWLEETWAHHSGKTPEEVREDIERDKILSAQEAKEYGLIDEVLTPRKASLED